MRCNKTVAVMAVAGLFVWASGEAWAFLDTGTLLTNSASATYGAGTPGNYQQSSISYSATAKILVANPAVFLWKDIEGPTCVTATAGGMITFSICFSNGGANSAFNVTVKDRLPNSTFWMGQLMYDSWYIDLAGASQTLTAWYATAANGTWLQGAYPGPPAGCGGPTTASNNCPYLQWVVPALGVGRSGCVRFMVSVG